MKYAKIENNVVSQIIVLDIASEKTAKAFIKNELGLEGTWLSAEKNNTEAGVGGYYLETEKKFVPAKPFDSWVLNTEKTFWIAPKAYPLDGQDYAWDEKNLDWTKK